MSDDTTGAKRPYDGWTDAQWRDWFVREVETTPRWRAMYQHIKVSQMPRPPGDPIQIPPGLQAGLTVRYETKSGVVDEQLTAELAQLINSLIQRGRDRGFFFVDQGEAMAFYGLGTEGKASFYEAWLGIAPPEPSPAGEDARQPDSGPIETVPPAIGSDPGQVDDGIQDADAEAGSLDWGDESYDVNITLPGGSVVAFTEDTSEASDGDGTSASDARIIYSSDTDDGLKRPFEPEPEDDWATRFLAFLRKHKIPLAISGAVGAIGAIAAVSITAGGGNDSTDTDAAAPPSTPIVTDAAPGGAVAGTTALAPISPATTAPDDACTVAAEQDYDMQFSSVDVIDGIGEEFSQRAGAETGYQTPAFSWSGVPPAATELVIVMQWVPENRRDEIITATDLWEDTEPPGSSRWVLRGIDPGSTEIRRTNLDSGLPVGTQEIDHTGGIVQIGGEPAMNKFLGPDAPGRTYMFTLLALCDPKLGTPFDESLGWFRRYAIDTVWFFADAEF